MIPTGLICVTVVIVVLVIFFMWLDCKGVNICSRKAPRKQNKLLGGKASQTSVVTNDTYIINL